MANVRDGLTCHISSHHNELDDYDYDSDYDDGGWWLVVLVVLVLLELIIIIPVMAIMKAEGNFSVDNSFQQAPSPPVCLLFQKKKK